jgi:hypothetical protein
MLDPSPIKSLDLFVRSKLRIKKTTAEDGLVLGAWWRWSVLSEIFPGSFGVNDTVQTWNFLEGERKELFNGMHPQLDTYLGRSDFSLAIP